jgi:hypothetical protein
MAYPNLPKSSLVQKKTRIIYKCIKVKYSGKLFTRASIKGTF